ncbi:hypothetical protein F2Q68_00011540 [Brassica cretica]|uniref:Uncharacterized protein n=1 Tax=Brassica cretica TaxID=69181 RepID=A0A8S9KTI7_BRACR|nr:hypothetical protein F2Q68_00011540 [Brassica cretica]
MTAATTSQPRQYSVIAMSRPHVPAAADTCREYGLRNSLVKLVVTRPQPSSSFKSSMRYMSSSTISNKETQLLFSPDPASLEHSIRKEARSSSIDNNTCSSLDFVQPSSTQTLIPSTDTHSPPSTEDTHLLSTDILHPTSIDTPTQTSIDTEPRDMVATLILVRDDKGDLHDQEGHLRNAAGRLFLVGVTSRVTAMDDEKRRR